MKRNTNDKNLIIENNNSIGDDNKEAKGRGS